MNIWLFEKAQVFLRLLFSKKDFFGGLGAKNWMSLASLYLRSSLLASASENVNFSHEREQKNKLSLSSIEKLQKKLDKREKKLSQTKEYLKEKENKMLSAKCEFSDKDLKENKRCSDMKEDKLS